MIHKKEDFIRTSGGVFRCIVADKETAVFARVIKKRDGGVRTKMQDLFACGQSLMTTVADYTRFYRGKLTLNFPSENNGGICRKRRGKIVEEIYLK